MTRMKALRRALSSRMERGARLVREPL